MQKKISLIPLLLVNGKDNIRLNYAISMLEGTKENIELKNIYLTLKTTKNIQQ